MAFPNVDKFLVKWFLQRFEEVQLDLERFVEDTFNDLEAETEQVEIITYLTETTFTDSVQDREEGKRFAYILPHYPVAEVNFPQIAISLGQENQSDKFLGDATGESFPVTDDDGNIVAFDVQKGYLATATWQIDVVCGTKDEAIWLSRCCQRFICEALDELDQIGANEISISLADLKLDDKAMMQPMTVFNRAISISAKVANTWLKRVPAYTYRTGNNVALDGP